MPDQREAADVERIGQRDHVGDEVLHPVCIHIAGFGRMHIAALIGHDTAIRARKSFDLVPPGAVRFGKAMQEYQRRRIIGASDDDIKLDAGGKRDTRLRERGMGHKVCYTFLRGGERGRLRF